MGHCPPPHDAPTKDHDDHGMAMGNHMMHRMQAVLPSAPMTRDGSGTAWVPDASPMEGIHGHPGNWHTMLHGTLTPRVTAQDVFEAGTRGATRVSAPNWLMGMARREAGPGQLLVRAMVSLDPLTEGKAGYPLLFQTGESVDGRPLVDEQHPHDLVSELSLTYALPVGEDGAVFAYAAYPGEPALGPTAFMHRPSARHLVDSPISHHWQDATHILFGVATVGAAKGPFKLDASVFTGREPDDNRYNFDRPRFDAYSARLSLNPSPAWSFQVSSGYLTSPEPLQPDLDVVRTTASALYGQELPGGNVSGALIWGYNRGKAAEAHEAEHHTGHSVVAEADVLRGALALFGRGEWVQKSDEELQVVTEGRFNVSSLTLGAARRIARFTYGEAMLGATGTVYAVPEGLRTAYGDVPVSAQVFLRLNLQQ